MKLTISLPALKAALRDARNVAGKSKTLPILKNALLVADAKAGTLVLKGTDLELAIVVPTVAMVLESGEITVPFDVLRDIVGRLSDDVQLALEENRLLLKSGRSKFHLNTLSAAEFPEVELPEGAPLLTLSGKVFAEAVGNVLYATAKGEALSQVQLGVHVQADTELGRLAIEATDGYRLSRYLLDWPKGGEPLNVIVPKRAIIEVKNVVEATGAETVQLFYPASEKHATSLGFLIGDRYITTRTIDGLFPPVQQICPTGFTKVVSAVRRELIGALERTMVLAQAQEDRVLKLVFNEDELTIHASDGDRGNADDAIGIKWETEVPGEAFTIHAKGGFLNEALSASSSELVALNFNGPLLPIVLTDPNAQEPYALVMPVNRVEA
jgi:DNA polymerase-3 subunit beta